MNKMEFVEAIGKDLCDKKTALAITNRMFEVLGQNLKKPGDSFVVQGLGTFKVVHRKERLGRNPRTGQPLKIPAHDTVIFKESASRKHG